MQFILIFYNFLFIKLTAASNNNIRIQPQIDGNTIIFDGPFWKSIDYRLFRFFPECNTVIIKNTNIIKFPKGLHKLKKLHTIECINNTKLCVWDNLFTSIRNARSKIKKLILDGNKKHCLSTSISQIINLQELTISNAVIKSIESFNLLCECTNLISLNLSNNGITKLPKEMHKLKKLKYINLSGNGIIKLPACFYRLNMLNYLDISGNKLKQVNAKISALSKLENLNISNNLLSDLPSSFYSLNSLIRLNMSKNNFSSISPDIYKLHNLQFLSLDKNKLENLPIEFCNLQKLKILKLNQNLLYRIPFSVLLLTNLKELSVRKNKMIKILPNSDTFNVVKQLATEFAERDKEHTTNLTAVLKTNTLTMLCSLTKLDVSFNYLTEIKDELSNLKHLEKLNASYNMISTFSVKLSDLPVLTDLNLYKNELTLAPYFENNHDVSNINLNIARNYICDDNVNHDGYGIKQLQKCKFKMLCVYPQYEKKRTYKEVVQQENLKPVHWNLTRLNNLTLNNAKVHSANFMISNSFLMKVWNLVIKWFVYDSNTKINFKYNNATTEYRVMAILLNKIMNSRIIQQLETNAEETRNSSITNKFTDMLSNEILFNEAGLNNRTNTMFLSYIKEIFRQILEKINEAGNDHDKITMLRKDLTRFCQDCVDITGREVFEQTIHQYSLQYQFINKKSDEKLKSFIYSRINFYRETAFFETYKDFYNGDMQYLSSIRFKYSNKIGIYDDKDITRKRYLMSKIDKGTFMMLFLEKFSVEDIQNKLLLDINTNCTMLKEALSFLIKYEKIRLTNLTEASSDNPEQDLTQEENKNIENSVKNKFCTTMELGNEITVLGLNYTGISEILRHLGFVCFNNLMDTDN